MYTRVTSHESRPGKPSCLHLRSSPRGFPRPAVEQITGNTGLGEPLGYYPKHQHKMLHNDAAQQRPGEKPASAPEASQKSIRTQGQAKFKISTLASKGSRPEHTNAASLTGGNMETPHIIHIHGRHSPPTCLVGPYDPYHGNYAAAIARLDKKFTAAAHAPAPARMIPSLRGRTRASPLGPRT